MIVTVLFTQNSDQPATGLTLADIDIYLYSRAKSNGAVATVWNGVHPTEEIGGGMYSRNYADADPTASDYFGYAHYSGAESLDADYAYQRSDFSDGAVVWGYDVRTLTQAAAQIAAAVSGSTISVARLTTWSISLTGLGSVANRSKLYFTVKSDYDDADTIAKLQIEETGELLYIDGAEADDETKGSLTVDDEDAGDITVEVDESVTGLVKESGLVYDVKVVTTGGDVNVLTGGAFNVTDVVTRAVT